jgi:hypothetical protein
MGLLGGCLSVFGGLFVLGLILSRFGTNTTSTNSTSSAPTAKPNPKIEAMSDVKLDFTWSKTGFDNIRQANFRVHDNSDYDIKDF